MIEDKYRPRFHFTPERQWMNDPNGMVYFDGEYHLFYQYHPFSTAWGPMHWGHAVSTDLVRWEHLPIALEPDEHGAIFSGSAVVDWDDTTGFFDGKPGLVAIFTHHDTIPGTDQRRERQSLAYSTDRGRTWTKYEHNPVLADESFPDYRDPKVFWHKPTNRWVMALATGQTVSLYTSPDLKQWTFASRFGEKDGCHEGVWECPDLFELPIDGDASRTKWVLFVSIGNNPEFTEGSRTQYFIGDFDGTHFYNENSSDTVLWLDYGKDNYAGVSWSDVPGRRIYIGWMSNWQYAQVTPTTGWRSAMTIPRELSLTSHNDKLILVQQPVAELNSLRTETMTWSRFQVNEGVNPLGSLALDCFELIAEFEVQTSTEFGFRVRKSNSNATVIGYDVLQQTIFIDRSHSGEASFHPHFPGKHAAQLAPDSNNRVKMHVWVDRSSIELFANDGIVAITDLIFPGPDQQGIELYSMNGEVQLHSLMIFPIS